MPRDLQSSWALTMREGSRFFEASPPGKATPFLRTAPIKHRDRVLNALLWVLVFVPVWFCTRLVIDHWVNQRFLDDWAWAGDLVKAMKGELTLHDLFAVHLEHRPAIAKGLSIVVTILARGDVRSQCVLTLVTYLGSFLCLVRLWLKSGGLTIRDVVLPLLLCSLVLFTPVQWQTLLWPICSGTALPMLFLLLALQAAGARQRWWVRTLSVSLLSIAAMLSFASGALVWGLALPVMMWGGSMMTKRQRVGSFLLWGAMLSLFLGWYFTNFHNEALAAYAYGHGDENTVTRELQYFLSHPWDDLQFVAAFCGGVVADGWAMDTRAAAIGVGWGLLAALAAGAAYVIIHWRENAIRAQLLPWFCFALYTPCTGLLVAVGRIYAGGPNVGLNIRYHVHQTQILIGLIALAFIILRHWTEQRSEETRRIVQVTAGVVCGLSMGVIALGWIYGSSMMAEWQGARLKNSTAQRLSQVFPHYNRPVADIAGNFSIGVNTVHDLDQFHLLTPSPLKDRRLSNFPPGPKPLNTVENQFLSLTKDQSGDWHTEGFSVLPRTHRTPDGILFAYREPGKSEWTIFGFTHVYGVPHFLTVSMVKDLWGIRPGRDFWPADFRCAWEEEVAVAESPPPGALISAWAVNAQYMEVSRVFHPHGDAKSDDEGSTLESLKSPAMESKGSNDHARGGHATASESPAESGLR